MSHHKNSDLNYYKFDESPAAGVFIILHNLNTMSPAVEVWSKATDTVVYPTSIVATGPNQVTITLAAPIEIRGIVIGAPDPAE